MRRKRAQNIVPESLFISIFTAVLSSPYLSSKGEFFNQPGLTFNPFFFLRLFPNLPRTSISLVSNIGASMVVRHPKELDKR